MRKLIPQVKLLSAFALATSFLFITGCQREIDDPGGGNPGGGGGTPVVVNDNIMVTAGVKGIVVDENNQPVAGAVVSSGANTTTTDRYGVFHFNNISLSKENGHVKIDKAGYFTGHRTFATTAGRIHNVRIKLLPKTNTGNFTASSGGTVTLASGGKLVMPANAVTDASGNVYTGQVNIAMTWIDPVAANLPDIMMGDLRGVTTDGQERGLETFGMLGVEMTSPSGQVLKVATGKTAELTFPVPTSILSNAPATIDLWHFDEPTGRWKQEGTATKTGTNYVAQVSHFSFWNCDAPFPLINLCMKLVNSANSQPLVNVLVRIKRPNGSYGSGYTDSLGNLCGKVPKNEALILEVLDQCYNVAYAQNIGPFSADASLGTISAILPAANTLIITGTLQNCASANVTNGAVVIYTGGTYSYSVPVTNGSFLLTLLRCNSSPLNFSVLGIDYTALQQSILVGGSGTTGTVNVGTIQACGTSSAEYIEWLIDGTPYNFASPPDQIFTSDSTFAGPLPTTTTVFGSRQNAGTTSFSNFSFSNNQAAATNLPLNYVSVNAAAGLSSSQIITPSPVINTTVFGPPVTGYIEGNFAIQMNFSGTTRNVNCNFRVRRN
jgi:hypothetical protein